MRKPQRIALRNLYKEWHQLNDSLMLRPGKNEREYILRRQAEVVASIKRAEKR